MEDNPLIGITVDIEGEYLRLEHHYSDAIIRAGGAPVLIPLTGNPVSYAERIDGLLISGGNDLHPSYYNEKIAEGCQLSATMKIVDRKRSDFEFALIHEIIKSRKPVLGICYGMQLINVAFGGTLYQDIDSQLSVEINHRKGYHIIVITENRFLKKGRFSVNSTHHQAIKGLGTDLKAFAYSTDNLIEAFYMEDYHFLVGVQWHPERLIDDSLSSALFNSFVRASRKNKSAKS
ncbi:MAG: gamma-glutamyl-gamma-aminobutyrate hydrolase family protein [Nitrospirota bacterium]